MGFVTLELRFQSPENKEIREEEPGRIANPLEPPDIRKSGSGVLTDRHVEPKNAIEQAFAHDDEQDAKRVFASKRQALGESRRK